jgi:hypothetical protein
VFVACAAEPTVQAQPPGSVFVRLALGQRQSCAVMPDGSARCRGENGSGELGDGGSARNAGRDPARW